MKPNRRAANQKGSALLLVLVMAAIVGIMLYQELPVVSFEAERQKEQLLMNRGNEYSRAIKLYVRKFQTFPPSMDALENTNRMRFLRFRYVDPFTGKADWRIIHAGPGGTFTDSKIKQTGSGLTPGSSSNGSTTGTNSTALGAPSTVTNPFANSFDGSNPNGTGQPAGPTFPQRPPAISAGVVANGGGPPPVGPDGQPIDPATLANGMQNPQQPVDPNNPLATSSGPGSAFPPGRFRGGNPMGSGDSYPPGQMNAPTDPSASNPMQTFLNNPNQAPTVQNNQNSNSNNGGFAFGNNQNQNGTTNGGSGMGTMAPGGAGGIGGVASISPGPTIKTLNDQTDRSLWEFVYDLQKDRNANLSNALGNGNNNGTNNNNNNNGIGPTNNGTGTGSGFSMPSSSFGQSPTATSGTQPSQTSN